jgi:hypothetical protein
MYKNRFLRCPSCMVRASVYKDVGTYRDEQFLNTSDLEMYLRISRKYSIGILEEHLFRYRWGHGNSGQKYRYLRTDPERYFKIMDLYLEQGGYSSATSEALAAYEAHRAEDHLMRVVNHYILGQCRQARSVLALVRLAQLLRSRRIQRGRLVILLFLLRLLIRVPKSPLIASMFSKHWHSKSELKKPVSLKLLNLLSNSEL